MQEFLLSNVPQLLADRMFLVIGSSDSFWAERLVSKATTLETLKQKEKANATVDEQASSSDMLL